jgi:hypothetical protein
MLLRSQELYEPISERDYRESLNEPPLPHGALSSRFRAPSRARRFYNFACAAFCELHLDGILRRLHAPILCAAWSSLGLCVVVRAPHADPPRPLPRPSLETPRKALSQLAWAH